MSLPPRPQRRRSDDLRLPPQRAPWAPGRSRPLAANRRQSGPISPGRCATSGPRYMPVPLSGVKTAGDFTAGVVSQLKGCAGNGELVELWACRLSSPGCRRPLTWRVPARGRLCRASRSHSGQVPGRPAAAGRPRSRRNAPGARCGRWSPTRRRTSRRWAPMNSPLFSGARARAGCPMSAADVEAWLDYEVSRPVPTPSSPPG